MAESAFYKQVFENNRKWIAEKKAIDKDYFTRLAQGQKPEILYIGCSDSRATAEELMGAGPGQVFVHRNIANIVGSSDLNALSVVNFAIGTLHVKHVVVCGHYGCGGVKAAMVAKDMGLLNPWLRHVRDVYRLHREELGRITDEEQRYRRLVELNVEEQCINVIKTAVLQKSYLRNRTPTVHGWVFDMHTGELMDLRFDFPGKLEEVRQIYDLGSEL
ncbi:MAG: carbonic anhydrase [Flavobacteriales bacterium]|jgi:carbonic anhydrase|nr:carbonic anhydrase [Flavobacteriales bacterium]MCB0758304.1 carbonic anhydrase [Flavobacteriales bacterium]